MAQYNMGYLVEHGQAGLAKDDTEALQWYRKSAEQDYAAAENRFGVMYLAGRGGLPDATEAVKWFRKSAEQGYTDAQYNLGYLYQQGAKGIPKDLEQAKSWYGKAAEQGDTDAKKRLQELELLQKTER